MRLALARDPVQYKVRCRHQDNLPSVSVESIFARPKRPLPNAALTLSHALAVAKRDARQVVARLAVIADHHTDVSNGHYGLGNQFDRCEPAVNEIGAVGDRLVLPAAAAAAIE